MNCDLFSNLNFICDIIFFKGYAPWVMEKVNALGDMSFHPKTTTTRSKLFEHKDLERDQAEFWQVVG